MKLKIGVDVDGTINNFFDILKQTIKEEYDLALDETQYYALSDIFTAKEEEKFWETHAHMMYDKCSVQPFALETLDWIFKNHILYIITARNKKCTDITIDWLKKNHIRYNDIYMETGHKGPICKELDIDLLIDDSPFNSISCSNNDIPVLLFDYPYNRALKQKEPIYRIYNWLEVKEFLEDLANEDL